MFTQRIPVNKLSTIALLLLCAAARLWGCALTGAFPGQSVSWHADRVARVSVGLQAWIM